MGSLETKDIATLRDYMECIEELMAGATPLWYRGCGKASYALAPSLSRHPDASDPARLSALEDRIVRRFRERSLPYQRLPQGSNEEWELLFLMQHYGVPTRLLDWTENPYVALFFALTEAKIEPTTGAAIEDAAVWVLKPEDWNRRVFADISHDGSILSVGDELLRTFLPSENIALRRNLPAAVFGLHNSARIVAQRGVFTIFGREMTPMEQRVTSDVVPPESLIKLVLPAAQVHVLRDSLISIGITDSVVFPDLAGLARELKRFFGYEV